MPPLGKPAEFPMTPYPQQDTTPQAQIAEPERNASTSTSTLPPLEAGFLTELGFSGGGAGMNGMMVGDGIDWDALMNNGELFNSFGGGWSAGLLDEQSLK